MTYVKVVQLSTTFTTMLLSKMLRNKIKSKLQSVHKIK